MSTIADSDCCFAIINPEKDRVNPTLIERLQIAQSSKRKVTWSEYMYPFAAHEIIASASASPPERTPLVIFILVVLALARLVMPKKDKRFKSGYRHFTWLRVFIGSGLYILGLVLIFSIFMG